MRGLVNGQAETLAPRPDMLAPRERALSYGRASSDGQL
jgi:hypothetical protein